MEEVFITMIVFFGIYQILKLFSDHFLKRKIINSGHIDKAGILSPVSNQPEESNKYPSLKWGLLALMAGLGLIVINLVYPYGSQINDFQDTLMPFGIELVFVSLGFLIYFFIANRKVKQ